MPPASRVRRYRGTAWCLAMAGNAGSRDWVSYLSPLWPVWCSVSSLFLGDSRSMALSLGAGVRTGNWAIALSIARVVLAADCSNLRADKACRLLAT